MAGRRREAGGACDLAGASDAIFNTNIVGNVGKIATGNPSLTLTADMVSKGDTGSLISFDTVSHRNPGGVTSEL